MKVIFIFLLLFSLFIIVFWVYWNPISKPRNRLVFYNQHKFLNYKYLKQYHIEPKLRQCLNGAPYILIIVTSYVGHVELRSAHRRSMSQQYLQQYNATRVFLLAHIPSSEKYITQDAINDESNTFGDILQGNFIENYRNLTLKHLMGLTWASTYCNNSIYILKVDDDTVFSLDGTYNVIRKERNTDKNNFLLGYMLNDTKPRRDRQNKWYVTREEYQYNTYPPYVSGWYYLTTPQVAKKLTEMAQYEQNFWIDDILVTGILTEMVGIKLKQLPDIWLEYYELLECCMKDMIESNIICRYVVGPNGGRNNLILEFNEALKSCQVSNKCVERSIASPLKKNCIAYKDRSIFSDGHPEVNIIKL